MGTTETTYEVTFRTAALDPAAEPKERRNDFPNSLDNPSCSDGSVVVKNVLW